MNVVWTVCKQRPSLERPEAVLQSLRETLACESEFREAEIFRCLTRLVPAHRPQLVASFKPITVPQTPKQDETSRAAKKQKDVGIFSFF